MSKVFIVSKHVTREDVLDFVYNRTNYSSIKIDDELTLKNLLKRTYLYTVLLRVLVKVVLGLLIRKSLSYYKKTWWTIFLAGPVRS
jgi:hypothetical protein